MTTKAIILADSLNSFNNKRLTTFQVEFPRIIIAELNTHRTLSRNFSSSRAIPFKAMKEQLQREYFIPSYWGLNKSGMQAEETLSEINKQFAEKYWRDAFNSSLHFTEVLAEEYKVHKQLANRLLEPFTYVKGVVSATEWDNFFHLRAHKDAQPEIQELAYLMKEEMDKSIPITVKETQWHIPWFDYIDDDKYSLAKVDRIYDRETACMISASLSAQVSYRKEDFSVDRAISIYERLAGSEPKHFSPFEHVAKPLQDKIETGVTHKLLDGTLCSGNFVGWNQYRHFKFDLPLNND